MSAKSGAQRWRRGGGVWLIYLLQPLGAAWSHHRLLASIGGTLLLFAFALSYLFLVPLCWRTEPRWRLAPIAVPLEVFALSVGSAAVIGVAGLVTVIFVAATLIVTLEPKVALPFAAVLAVAVGVVPQYIEPWHQSGTEWSLAVAVALASTAILGFTRLLQANHELTAARETVATLAAEHERMRIARDLHDLLGHSLTTVTVKAAVAARLVDSDPARARSEMGEVELLAREALADVRTAVAGYREVRLATELATAREVLAAAGIAAELPQGVDHVAGELAGLFGWVVREGVTNVVRHSRAHRVRVTVGAREIEIVDDGCGAQRAAAGHGLTGLAERAAAVGGRLVTGTAADGFSASGFRLRVEVPG